MELLLDLGLFFGKSLIIALLIVTVIILTVSIATKAKGGSADQLQVTLLNEKLQQTQEALAVTLLNKPERKALLKQNKRENTDLKTRPKTYILSFHGDMRASKTADLRNEITAILSIATTDDEIILLLESPGGMVPHYGLAASQLKRIRGAGIPLTIIVDKVAASGGYMMAAQADQIIAAPFAIVGSIGVVLQIPNFSKLLKKKGIDFEQITAGEYKRTLTMFGENTSKGRKKMESEIEETHELFKQDILLGRPDLNLEKVATGEHWYGQQALDLGLIDKIQCSDDYLSNEAKTRRLVQLRTNSPKGLLQKLSKTQDAAFGILRSWL